jgi:hypothetical protein
MTYWTCHPSTSPTIHESIRIRGTPFFTVGQGLWDHAGSFPPLAPPRLDSGVAIGAGPVLDSAHGHA